MDRRKHVRFTFTNPQEVIVNAGNKCQLVDISNYGAKLSSPTVFNSSKLQFKLELPVSNNSLTLSHTIILKGNVVWQKENQMGIEFGLSKENEMILKAYIDFLLRDKKIQEVHDIKRLVFLSAFQSTSKLIH